MAKDEMLSLRLSKEDKKHLEKDARDEDRSVGNMLLWCWKKWRKENKK